MQKLVQKQEKTTSGEMKLSVRLTAKYSKSTLTTMQTGTKARYSKEELT